MARQNVTLGKVFGIEINVSFSWFVIFGLVTVLLATAYYPETYPKLPRYEYLALGLVTSILFFASVLLHELMHSVVAKFNHINIKSITLFIFGGVAHMDHDPETPRAEFFMAVAGPLTSFLLSAFFTGVFILATSLNLGVAITGPTLYLGLINLYLAVFNLVPGFPLDGGRVLRAFLWFLLKDVRKATRIASLMGQGFAILLISAGLYMFFIARSFWLNGLWFIFIGIFLQQVAAAGYEEVILHWTLNGVKVRDIMTPGVVTVDATTMLTDLVNDFFMRYKHSRFPVVEDGRVIGIVTLDNVKDVPREKWEVTRTRAITPLLNENESVSPDATAEEAIAQMTELRRGHLVVMDKDVLSGILTMNDLAGAIQVRRSLGG
jgi:Zn-dependent protease